MAMLEIRAVYPEFNGEGSLDSHNYQPLIESMDVKILVYTEDYDYQGDSLLLLQDNDTNRYGILTFGWGSCSVCDALLRCDTYEDLEELRTELFNSIQWFDDPLSVYKYIMIDHDWEGTHLDLCLIKEFKTLVLHYFQREGIDF